MSRTLVLVLIAAAALAGCGKKKPVATVAPPPTTTTAPAAVKQKPPAIVVVPLTADQRARIEVDFAAARKIVNEARDFRKKGEAIEKKDGRVAANDTLVEARKRYRQAVGQTEKWVEPELHEVSAAQVATDSGLKTFMDERGHWIQEDASMGAKLNMK